MASNLKHRLLWCMCRRGAGSASAAGGARASALEPQCWHHPAAPRSEPVCPLLAGSAERARLAAELTALCRAPAELPRAAAPAARRRAQHMPFDHARVAAFFSHATDEMLSDAFERAARAQPAWERTPVEKRCEILESAASLLAGKHRYRVVAAAVVGSATTVMQAEHALCQLVDHIRVSCHQMRHLTRSSCVLAGGDEARNMNHYHGLEGFWVAITPHESFAHAGQLALTPVLMGNAVLWKPSDHSVLVAQRVAECARAAGVPAGVLQLVPAAEGGFLRRAAGDARLAGVALGGSTDTLQLAHRLVARNLHRYHRLPRVVGIGSANNFHVVGPSAQMSAAVACTARAAFESAGQKVTSCSRVFVAESIAKQFAETLAAVTTTLLVCNPIDCRTFMSALVSREAYDKAAAWLRRLAGDCEVLSGGRADAAVGYYVEPTLVRVAEPQHPLMRCAVRAPLLAVHAFPDADFDYLTFAVGTTPYAVTGAIFSEDAAWAARAVGALRDLSTSLFVNERCSEPRAGQHAYGGSRRSGDGGKVGSISYLLQFCSERALTEVARPCGDVTYPCMRAAPEWCPRLAEPRD